MSGSEHEIGLRYRLRRAARQIADQHRHLQELYALLDAALAEGADGRARSGFGRYREALAAHFALEEEVFFPAIHGLEPEKKPALDALVRAHDGFLEDLARIGAALVASPVGRLAPEVHALAALLAEHEREEEALLGRIAAER